MKNQPRRVKGYHKFTQEEINILDRIKEKMSEVDGLIVELEGIGADKKWLETGMTALLKGFMALDRSIGVLPDKREGLYNGTG